MEQTIFLKLGGSLITDKDQPMTALIPQIDQIAKQIKEFNTTNPKCHLLLGHGSGSFGHVAASKYHTRDGVNTQEQWLGFIEVWHAARALDQIILESFSRNGLPVICFPLSASAVTKKGMPLDWNWRPIQQAIEHQLIPMIFGDVVLDDTIGGTILSTEEQFAALVPFLSPDKILLAGSEIGVWQDFPACKTLIPEITPSTYPGFLPQILGSASVDVTGGMASKVIDMLTLIQKFSNLEISIFSGKNEDSILHALNGEKMGTLLRTDQ
ncbi:MAG: isopentenyl phosphate kinase [Anaerolineaceae bacterium]